MIFCPPPRGRIGGFGLFSGPHQLQSSFIAQAWRGLIVFYESEGEGGGESGRAKKRSTLQTPREGNARITRATRSHARKSLALGTFAVVSSPSSGSEMSDSRLQSLDGGSERFDRNVTAIPPLTGRIARIALQRIAPVYGMRIKAAGTANRGFHTSYGNSGLTGRRAMQQRFVRLVDPAAGENKGAAATQRARSAAREPP